jgi:iron complex outermembrane receptor protein
MKPIRVVNLIFILFILFSGCFAYPEEKNEALLEEIVVKGEKLVVPAKEASETVYTGNEITKKGIELSGEKGKTNVFEAISILPGIVFESSDSNNLATEQVNIRIRGVRAQPATGITVEGIPTTGGPLRHYIYDLENFENISVYKGAIPSDFGTGVGNRGGAIELKPLWADEKFGFKISQSAGSFEYRRTFFRLDSGKINPLNTKFSVSYSFTQEDKWKGPGDIGPRNNFNITVTQPLGQYIEIKLWGNFNEIKHYKYRYLSYPEIKDLKRYYRTDFNEEITGIPAQDYLYYKFNMEKHNDKDLFGLITIKPAEKIKILLKPYISDNKALLFDGRQNGTVQKTTRDIERKGIVSEIEAEFAGIKAKAGYLFEKEDLTKIYTENYRINSNGSLSYLGYGIFSSAGTYTINSPYIKISGTHGNLNWQAGIKYFHDRESAVKGYLTQIVSGNPLLVRAPDLDRTEKTYEVWIPNAGLSYLFSENLEAYISYGKTFRRPYNYMALINLYTNLRARFQSAGLKLEDLFNGLDVESSDNLDVGLRFRKDFVEFNPVFFLSKHKNLLTTVTDPRVTTLAGVPVNYPQNIGKAKGYGMELGTNFFVLDWLTFYVNPVYNHLVYNSDITYQGKTLSTKGKQLLDVPKWTIVSGLIMKYKDFEVIPQMRYIGKRYGDCEHNEEVPSYAVFDLKLNYVKEKLGMLKALKLSLELDNIFDKKHVSVINAMDDSITGTTYYAGAPFTAKASISFAF